MLAGVLTTLSCGWVTSATIQTYTSRPDFLAALAGSMRTWDFESLPPGIGLADGTTVDGFTLYDSVPAPAMAVTESYAQTTPAGARSLGLLNPDEAFDSGDTVIVAFDRPTLAAGLTVIGSPGDIRPGDLVLGTEAGEVVNSGVPDPVLPDGGEAHFLGLIVTDPDPGSAFYEVVLTSIDPTRDGLFIYTIDDVVLLTPPEPGTGSADLMLYRTGPAVADVPSEVTYLTVLNNEGPSNAWDLVIDHRPPPGTLFLVNEGDATRNFPVVVSMLPPNRSVTIKSTYYVPNAYDGPVVATSIVSVTSATADPDPGQEIRQWRTVIDPAGDRDRDGMSNAAELAADTDPTRSASRLAIVAVTPTNGTVRVTWEGGTRATQVLERASIGLNGPGPWSSILTNLPPTPALSTAPDPSAAGRTNGMYRIRIPM